MLAEGGQVFGGFELLELLEVLGGLEILADLVEVAGLAPRLGDCPFREGAHCVLIWESRVSWVRNR